MSKYKLLAIILITIFLGSCSIADNQSCAKDSLLTYAREGDSEKIEACYKAGADIQVSDKEGTAIYTLALNNGHKDLAARLQVIQFQEWQKNNSLLEAQLFYNAIEYNNVAMVSKFIEGNFDLRAKHLNGVAPIVYAVFNESNDIVDLLLKNGVSITYEFDFRPLLCIAAMFNQIETAKVLVANGANINANDGSGVTPLMFAARDGYSDMVKYLLANGADKEAKDIKDQTALDMAKVKKQEEVIQLLKDE